MRTLEPFALTAAAAAALGLVAVSCAPIDEDVVRTTAEEVLLPPPFPDGTPPPQGRQWVLCQVAEGHDAESAVVTPGQADTLRLEAGHELRIPANALIGGPPVQIQFMQRPGRGVAVILLPEEQAFDNPLTLTLVYRDRGCAVVQPNALDIFRLRTNPPHEHALVANPLRDPRVESISVRIDHFTSFAIAQ